MAYRKIGPELRKRAATALLFGKTLQQVHQYTGISVNKLAHIRADARRESDAAIRTAGLTVKPWPGDATKGAAAEKAETAAACARKKPEKAKAPAAEGEELARIALQLRQIADALEKRSGSRE